MNCPNCQTNLINGVCFSCLDKEMNVQTSHGIVPEKRHCPKCNGVQVYCSECEMYRESCCSAFSGCGCIYTKAEIVN